jgi:hypothetical protein
MKSSCTTQKKGSTTNEDTLGAKIDEMLKIMAQFNEKSGFSSRLQTKFSTGNIPQKLEMLTSELTQITNYSSLKFERMELDNKRLRNELLNIQN